MYVIFTDSSVEYILWLIKCNWCSQRNQLDFFFIHFCFFFSCIHIYTHNGWWRWMNEMNLYIHCTIVHTTSLQMFQHLFSNSIELDKKQIVIWAPHKMSNQTILAQYEVVRKATPNQFKNQNRNSNSFNNNMICIYSTSTMYWYS